MTILLFLFYLNVCIIALNLMLFFQLYSLLFFINPKIFKLEEMEEFVKYFGSIVSGNIFIKVCIKILLSIES